MSKNKKVEQKNNFDLKKILKTIKLNESSISMILGVIVLIIVGSLVIKYLNNNKGSIPEELLKGTNSIESSQKIHKVAKGENLWQISVKYYGDGFKWVDVATENRLMNASEIEVGQELIIPNLETAIKDDEAISTEEKEQTNLNISESITATTYETVKGDSLWKISVRAYGDGYKWTLIAKENKLSNPNKIHPGNILVLPR